jgi:hypothetical protein
MLAVAYCATRCGGGARVPPAMACAAISLHPARCGAGHGVEGRQQWFQPRCPRDGAQGPAMRALGATQTPPHKTGAPHCSVKRRHSIHHASARCRSRVAVAHNQLRPPLVRPASCSPHHRDPAAVTAPALSSTLRVWGPAILCAWPPLCPSPRHLAPSPDACLLRACRLLLPGSGVCGGGTCAAAGGRVPPVLCCCGGPEETVVLCFVSQAAVTSVPRQPHPRYGGTAAVTRTPHDRWRPPGASLAAAATARAPYARSGAVTNGHPSVTPRPHSAPANQPSTAQRPDWLRCTHLNVTG